MGKGGGMTTHEIGLLAEALKRVKPHDSLEEANFGWREAVCAVADVCEDCTKNWDQEVFLTSCGY